jgi:protein arginine kinase activator
MLCESCNEHEATVHLTQVVDGSVKKVHLCEDCAAKSGLDVHGPISITDILLGMGGGKIDAMAEDRSCARCHLRRSDFKKTGRLGCPSCYETFGTELLPMIKAMHRSEQHSGKVPSSESMTVKMTAEVAILQQQLEQAVAAEDYEKAARLRDAIAEWRAKAADDSEAGRQ